MIKGCGHANEGRQRPQELLGAFTPCTLRAQRPNLHPLCITL